MQQPPTQDSAPVRRPVKAGFFGLTVGRPIAMGVLFVTLILLGAIAYTRIPLQFLPGGIQGTRFSIIVPNPGASAQENVDKVARILEEQRAWRLLVAEGVWFTFATMWTISSPQAALQSVRRAATALWALRIHVTTSTSALLRSSQRRGAAQHT